MNCLFSEIGRVFPQDKPNRIC